MPSSFRRSCRRHSSQQELLRLRGEPEERTSGWSTRYQVYAPSISEKIFWPSAMCAGNGAPFAAGLHPQQRKLSQGRYSPGREGSQGRWAAVRKARGDTLSVQVARTPPAFTQSDTLRSRGQPRRKPVTLKRKRSEGAPAVPPAPGPSYPAWL